MKAPIGFNQRQWRRLAGLTTSFVICFLFLAVGFGQAPVGQVSTTQEPTPKAAVLDKSAFPLMIEPDSGFYFPYEYQPGRTPQVGDPLSSATGEYRESWPLFSLGGVLPLEVSLLYAPDLFNRTIAGDGPYQMSYYLQSFTTDAIYRLIEFDTRVPHRRHISTSC